MSRPSAGEVFQQLCDIIARLRAPDGCPWDREQTPASLRRHVLEEAYEVVEAIDAADAALLTEELGDLMMQPVLQAQIAAETAQFDMVDVLVAINEKLVRRHPHVFGDAVAEDAATVVHRWEEIKRREKGRSDEAAASLMDDVPDALPALMRAQKVQARASRVGFDWDSPLPATDKVREELDEVLAELQNPHDGGNAVEAEVGDLLFAVVNVARLAGVDAESALRQATNRFAQRFRAVEAGARETGRGLHEMTLAEMDVLWEDAKRNMASSGEQPGR